MIHEGKTFAQICHSARPANQVQSNPRISVRSIQATSTLYTCAISSTWKFINYVEVGGSFALKTVEVKYFDDDCVIRCYCTFTTTI